MNKIILPLTLMLLLQVVTSCGSSQDEPLNTEPTIKVSSDNVYANYEGVSSTIKVTASEEWEFTTNGDVPWLEVYKNHNGQYLVVRVSQNTIYKPRSRTITLKCGNASAVISVKQDAATKSASEENIEAPKGYKMVWHDEFNKDYIPSGQLWRYQTEAVSWGNNELQQYVKNYAPVGDYLAKINEGILTITLAKHESSVYSISLSPLESWTYGYFEARLKLPKGKGTLPTFCLLPKDYKQWIGDGEIDIMQEVGHSPNNVYSSVQCKAYNRKDDTPKTQELYVEGAQDDFHIYAVEWTKEYIRTLVDGEQLLYFENEGNGTSETYNVWPFYSPFTPNLRLAWGGDWAGAEGLDESCLPAEFQIDYVRVFQKNYRYE